MREVFSIAYTPADSAEVVVVPNLAMRLLEENTTGTPARLGSKTRSHDA